MIETVFSAALPVGEQLMVRKNRIMGATRTGPRVVVVTGIHGDELEGQFVAYELGRRLQERPSDLRGVVDIYPAVNPLGLSTRERGVPHFDLDLDRTFPGKEGGSLTEAMAHAIFQDIVGCTVCIDVHAPSVFVKEVTQVRIDEQNSDVPVRLASLLNVGLVWVREPAPTQGSTLAHALNEAGTPALVVSMGTGMSLDEEAGTWLVEGIICLLERLGAWAGPTVVLPPPRITRGENVCSLCAEQAGIFLPRAEHGRIVRSGQVIGVIADPLEGMVRSEIHAPCDGLLFTLRTYPLVYPGSLVARILGGVR